MRVAHARPVPLQRGRAMRPLPVVLVIALALSGLGFHALQKAGRPGTTEPASVAPQPSAQATNVASRAAPAAAPITKPQGWVDTPKDEVITGSRVAVSGWALDPAGIRGVEVRLDGKAYPVKYGIARPDVARAKAGFPDSAAAGFAFEGDFGPLSPQRHELAIVAISQSGGESVLARKSLIPPAAMPLWRELLDTRAGLARDAFTFLMMTSGVVAFQGAIELDTIYRPYLSRTQKIGVAVPILYLRTTHGEKEDWRFDPGFDLTRKCGNRAVADDNLAGVMRYALEKRLPTQFILNGGIWADATCDTPTWDLNDHLEQDIANCQWTQGNEVFPDDYRKGLVGSSDSPQLARSLTYNIYARSVRAYKKRNLQAAAQVIAKFAREHPELFVGITLDADVYMNPFVRDGRRFDYNPGMLKQFRQWLTATGPYAGRPEPGIPDLSAYRRKDPLTLAAINRLARKEWKTLDEVDPPRTFSGEPGVPVPVGAQASWQDPWYLEWDGFRKHVVQLHFEELARWTHEAGIPSDRIFTAQAFIAPDAGLRPVSLNVRGGSPEYDSAGVSIEGAAPRSGHLGAILYGPAAANATLFPNGHNLFANIARFDSRWAISEYNATDLKQPSVLPTYELSYRTFRDLFNYDGRQISMMAWNGSNGIFAGQPGYVPYTAFRNTPAEDAMKDFLVSHADLPRGARLWTFGSPRYATDDGWTAEDGAFEAGPGLLALQPHLGAVTLVSPADQVIRPDVTSTAVLDVGQRDALVRLQVFARMGPNDAWTPVTRGLDAKALRQTAAGFSIPLEWPEGWRGRNTIVEQIRVRLEFAAEAPAPQLTRIALYPRRN